MPTKRATTEERETMPLDMFKPFYAELRDFDVKIKNNKKVPELIRANTSECVKRLDDIMSGDEYLFGVHIDVAAYTSAAIAGYPDDIHYPKWLVDDMIALRAVAFTNAESLCAVVEQTTFALVIRRMVTAVNYYDSMSK